MVINFEVLLQNVAELIFVLVMNLGKIKFR